jgi:hypothetical protein
MSSQILIVSLCDVNGNEREVQRAAPSNSSICSELPVSVINGEALHWYTFEFSPLAAHSESTVIRDKIEDLKFFQRL